MADAGQGGGQAGGAGERALAMMGQARTRFSAMPAQRRTWLLASVAMLVAMASAMAWYAQRPDWRVLFNGLEGKDLQQVSQNLGAAGIPFQLTADGAGVQVPAEMLDKARMEVAAKGMPQSGRLGFELFDKPNWVGSEFDEKVNYQRALEGELEHTIETLGVVRSARVHLVLPRESLFAAEQQPAKASVVVKLKKASLTAEQIDSVRSLVAGAVENLSVDQVTLVDADGRVNLDSHRGAPGQAEVEQAMENKLIAMLEPLAGAGNVRATVNVSYDQGSEERTDEVYDPSLSVPVTVQKSEQTTGAGGVAGHASGVPGTASNTPAAAPVNAVQGSAQAAAPGTAPLLVQPGTKEKLPVYPEAGGGAGQTIRQEAGSYAVTKHTVHTESGPGRMRRVTAAVVINDRAAVEGAGKLQHVVWRPRTADEMHRLEGLAQAAVGYDEKRGDQVVLQNVAFNSNVPPVVATGFDRLLEEGRGLAQTQQGALRTATMGVIALVLVWFVMKPVAQQVVATLKEPAQPRLAQQGAYASLGPADDFMEDGAEEASRYGSPALVDGHPRKTNELISSAKPEWTQGGRSPAELMASGPEGAPAKKHIFDQVAEHVRREPGESTRLLAAWISADEEGA